MVSSTFTDLKAHREAIIAAIHKHHLHANVMEHDDAKVESDLIESSLNMVRDSHAYILVISLKYGQTPVDPVRNPDQLSITELEFNEAQRLKRPMLLFIMGDDHQVKKADIELDPEKEKKLNAFRERAKQKAPSSAVHRVYAVFNSLDEFRDKIAAPLAELQNILAPKDPTRPQPPTTSSHPASTIPTPPEFYAAPDYIGRHTFIGRQAQLKTLSDWAQPTDRTNVLLFEAIGGNGKSMLTWEWTTKYATTVRSDWAGRFWYSFYERGAIMRQFCQHALAYMTQQPLAAFAEKTNSELQVELLAQLHQRPWLLILDGLERVLVAYHRFDAAEVRDEEVNRPTDKILQRDPCDAIRDEDTALLRALAVAAPSKILISSRLIPRALLNQAGLPLPGVRPLELPGLDEADAEELLRSCSIQGTSADIRYYLTNYCANHPLVIGVLAGLINSPGPHRGNFDGWAADPDYGAKLNLARLNLVQQRNHILRAAIDALEPASRQLLSTLALLSNSVDYATVAAFNPHLPPVPEEVEEPEAPEKNRRWHRLNDEGKVKLRQAYETARSQREAYEQALQTWREDVRVAPAKLIETITDLEDRGLLQFDRRTNRYDLHPVVRGVASGGLKEEEKERYGKRVVDFYNSQPHSPYEQAKSLDDVESSLNVVRTLLKLGHYQLAADAYKGDLANAMFANLEAHAETLALLRPFFSTGWDRLPNEVDDTTASYLATSAAIAMDESGEYEKALDLYAASLRAYVNRDDLLAVFICIMNISATLTNQRRWGQKNRLGSLALELAFANDSERDIFVGRLNLFASQTRSGLTREAETTWHTLDAMGRDWPRNIYRQGDAEYWFAVHHFCQGTMQEGHLVKAAGLAEPDNNRTVMRYLHSLRGAWRLDKGKWALAAASFTEAVTMARERRLVDAESETGLALAKFKLGQLTSADARTEAERLAQLPRPKHRLLARLWQALGDLDSARRHALQAYTWAWGDGEPYVYRYELNQTTALLHELSVPIPNLPPYDPSQDKPFPWEADVRAVIAKLQAEKLAKQSSKNADTSDS